MSDDLVKRLREGATWDDDIAAADRIEELEAKLKTMIKPQVAESMVRVAEPMLSDALAAADKRIEELEKACKEWADVSQSNYQRAKAAEAKLAKAVRLMELSVELATWNTTLLDDVIYFIAELKGEQPYEI